MQHSPPVEKLSLLESLARDLAYEEASLGLRQGGNHAYWSPTDAHEAAHILEEFIQREQNIREEGENKVCCFEL